MDTEAIDPDPNQASTADPPLAVLTEVLLLVVSVALQAPPSALVVDRPLDVVVHGPDPPCRIGAEEVDLGRVPVMDGLRTDQRLADEGHNRIASADFHITLG